MEHTMMKEQPLDELVTAFLTDLAHANRSPRTRYAYATDLAQLCAFYQGPMQAITAEVLRTFFSTHFHLSPATRARKQAAVARFLTWAEQHELFEANPMRKIDRVKLDPPQPRGVERSHIEGILTAIPAEHLRDRLFFRLLAEIGLRVSEGLSLYVEDLDLSLDNEHLTVVGKGGKRRTVLARRSASRKASPGLPETDGLQTRAALSSGKERAGRTTALPIDTGTLGSLLCEGRSGLYTPSTSAYTRN